MNIAGRLERLPLSAFHYRVFAFIGIAMLFDGYDLTITGFVIPPLVRAHWLDHSTTALFISLPLFGAAFGSITAGILGDWLGRRTVFKLNVLVYSVSSLLCGLAPTYGWLLAFRTVTLFALGTQIVTGYSYMNEMTPRLVRGRFQSAVSFLVNGGLPIGALLAFLFVPNLPIGTGWRILFLVSVIPAFLVFVGQRALPESPRWLVSAGREQEADRIVTALEGEIERNIGRPLPPAAEEPAPVRNLEWSTLLVPGVRRRFFVAVMFNICHLVTIFVLVSWLPSLLTSRGLTFLHSFTYSLVAFIGGFAGPFVGMLIADRIERRWQVVGAAIIGACCGLLYTQQSTPAGLMIVGFVLVSAIYFLSAVGFGAYLPEILPTGVRLRGFGLAVFIGRIASALSPFAVAWALGLLHNPIAIVASVGVLYLVMAAVVAVWGPNTSGRSLEALEWSMVVEGGLGTHQPLQQPPATV